MKSWYEFQLERWPKCFFCAVRPVEQFHHLAAVGSDLYRGLAPRRATECNAVGVCDVCHDNVHDNKGERRMIEAFLGSREVMYQRLTRRLADYIEYLREAA